jgi:hypothetical protein
MMLKVLSIKNPLSYIIATGIQDIENREFTTDYRGDIYIHSSGKYDYKELIVSDIPDCLKDEYEEFVKALNSNGDIDNLSPDLELFIQLQEAAEENFKKYKKPLFKSNAIIGKVTLVDILYTSNSKYGKENHYHWKFENFQPFDKPILYVNGKLGLFDVEVKDEILDRLNIKDL